MRTAHNPFLLLLFFLFTNSSFAQLQEKGIQVEVASMLMFGGERTQVEGGHLSGGSGIGFGLGVGYNIDGRLSADVKGIFQLNGHFNNINGWVVRSKFNNRIVELNGRYLVPLNFIDGLGIRIGGGPGFCSPSQLRILDDWNDYEYYADYGARLGFQAEFEIYYKASKNAALTFGVRYQNYGRFKAEGADISTVGVLPPGLETTTHDRSSQGIGLNVALIFF